MASITGNLDVRIHSGHMEAWCLDALTMGRCAVPLDHRDILALVGVVLADAEPGVAPWHEAESTNVRRWRYHAEARRLDVEFHGAKGGALYAYLDVPPETATGPAGMALAPAAGKSVNSPLKPHHRALRVHGGAPDEEGADDANHV